MPVRTQIQIRRGTSAEWSSGVDPLSQGEFGYDLTLKKIKIGDGSTSWSGLPWATILGSDLIGVSGIKISYVGSGSGLATVSVTGLSSSYISDFANTVSGLLPVKNIVAGNGVSISVSGDNAFVISTSGSDINSVKDIIGTSVTGVSGVRVDYNNTSKITTISLSDTSIQAADITDFSSAVSGLLPVKSITGSGDVSVASSGGSFTISSNIISFAPVNFSGSTNVSRNLSVGTVDQQFGFRSTTDPWVENQYVSFYDNDSDLVYTGKLRIQYAGGFGFAFGLHNVSSIVGTQNGSTSSNWTIRLAPAPETFVSSQITNFNSSVSGLVSGIYAPLNSPTFTGTVNGISKSMVGLGNVDNTSDANKPVSSATQSALNLKASLAGATFTGSVVIPSGSGNFNTLNVNNIPVSVSGHSHVSTDITNFNSSVSGLMGVKSLVGTSGIGIVNSAGTHTIAITGIPSSLITDLGNIATTEVVGRTGIALSYDSVYDIMYIDATGLSFNGHTHTWSNLTDASTRATLTELSYLSGVVPGTASAGKALVLDSSKNLSTVNNFSSSGVLSASVLNISGSGTIGDLVVGGNLIVNGSTTTINSTTITVDDKNLELGSVATPTDITADGAGITVKGATDKTFNWVNSTSSWTSSENLNLASGKVLKVAGTEILSATNYTGKAATAGNSDTVTTNANLTGPITSVGNATSIAEGVISNFHIASTGAIAYSKLNLSTSILNSDISVSAGIVDTKLATISTSGKVSNSATTATSANTASAIVARDASGNFSAGTITASLSGNASSVTNGVYTTDTGTVTNTMLAGSIANAKLLNSSVTLGSTSVSLGGTTSIIAGLTSISGVSSASPTALVYCSIDGGTP
jgi:hypothetical protein